MLDAGVHHGVLNLSDSSDTGEVCRRVYRVAIGVDTLDLVHLGRVYRDLKSRGAAYRLEITLRGGRLLYPVTLCFCLSSYRSAHSNDRHAVHVLDDLAILPHTNTHASTILNTGIIPELIIHRQATSGC